MAAWLSHSFSWQFKLSCSSSLTSGFQVNLAVSELVRTGLTPVHRMSHGQAFGWGSLSKNNAEAASVPEMDS